MEKRRIFAPVIFIAALVLFPAASTSLQEAGGSEGYIGSDTCRACHQERSATYLQSIHAKKALPDSPINRSGCESCHGPGAFHVKKRGGRGTGMVAFHRQDDPEAKSAQCLQCHQESRVVPFWDLGRHRVNGVSCTDCHRAHAGIRKNLKARQPELCNTCHRDVRAQQMRQSRHPLREGLLKCTQCHDQHGSFSRKMIRENSVNELCYICHADKRGPFLWEHPPMEENCLTCHTPHGSNHAKLLKSKAPLLCQSCHDAPQHPGTIYTRFETFQGSATSGKNRMFARSCLNCHSNIHGSMGPSVRGRNFVR